MRPPPKLSTVQLEVLTDVARGLENRQIANRQYRSVETIRTHLKEIYRKLHARNRAHAVAIAYHLGIFRGVDRVAVEARPLAPRDAAPEVRDVNGTGQQEGNHAGV